MTATKCGYGFLLSFGSGSYEISPVADPTGEGVEMEVVPPETAEAWAVYAIDGEGLRSWLGDFASKEEAWRFAKESAKVEDGFHAGAA